MSDDWDRENAHRLHIRQLEDALAAMKAENDRFRLQASRTAVERRDYELDSLRHELAAMKADQSRSREVLRDAAGFIARYTTGRGTEDMLKAIHAALAPSPPETEHE